MVHFPVEDDVLYSLKDHIEEELPELSGKIVIGPTDAAPVELQLVLFYDLVTVEWDGMEIAQHSIAIVVACPNDGNIIEIRRLVNRTKHQVFHCLKAGVVLAGELNDQGGVILTGPHSIVGTQISVYRPGGIEGLVTAEVRLLGQSAEGLEYVSD